MSFEAAVIPFENGTDLLCLNLFLIERLGKLYKAGNALGVAVELLLVPVLAVCDRKQALIFLQLPFQVCIFLREFPLIMAPALTFVFRVRVGVSLFCHTNNSTEKR